MSVTEQTARANRKILRLTFQDVEDFVGVFSGDGGKNIKHWIEDFERIR